MIDQGLFNILHNYVSELPTIDCHEHTYLPDARPEPVDLWTVIRNSDVGDDLISSGMPATNRPTLDWEQAAPYLSFVSNTGFYRSLILAFQKLFDLQENNLTASNWSSLSDHIKASNERPDWYTDVLKKQANIHLILRVQGDEADPYAIDREFFAPLIIFDDWILTTSPLQRESLAQKVDGSASTLTDYLNALDSAFQEAKVRRAVGIKSMLAYRRSIAHIQPTREDAERLFKRQTLSEVETKVFQDFMAHAVAERAGVFGFPYQVHVGYGSWQGNITEQANPLLLNPLIEAHRQTQFVLLHGGYPFIGEMGTLAKNHPNVFIECGWLAYIAPVAYQQALREWLDSVPANKLLAFSADCLHIEQTYGTLLLTRRLLAKMLAEKIEHDDWDEELAKSVVERLLYRNAAQLYQLDTMR